jgi:hypothetical protein
MYLIGGTNNGYDCYNLGTDVPFIKMLKNPVPPPTVVAQSELAPNLELEIYTRRIFYKRKFEKFILFVEEHIPDDSVVVWLESGADLQKPPRADCAL